MASSILASRRIRTAKDIARSFERMARLGRIPKDTNSTDVKLALGTIKLLTDKFRAMVPRMGHM